MAMIESLLQFLDQFDYTPEIINEEHFNSYSRFILNGMGGSHLHADLLTALDPSLDLTVRSTYGIPEHSTDDTLLIASSHSGNTEEVIDFAHNALEANRPLVCIATGGSLIDFAHEHDVPYIQMPDTGIQPRTALGFALLALVKVVKPERVDEIKALKETFDVEGARLQGEEIAERLRDHFPVINASVDNTSIAYNWKIKCNETGKIPSFYNIFPELNHNEMQGFDVAESNKHISERIKFIFIRDDRDHDRISRRMDVCGSQYEERGFDVISTHLSGDHYLTRAFNSLLTADWMALKIAEIYGTEPEEVPMIEEFKDRIA